MSHNAAHLECAEKLGFVRTAEAVRFLIRFLKCVGKMHHAHRVRAVLETVGVTELMDRFLSGSLAEALWIGGTAPKLWP